MRFFASKGRCTKGTQDNKGGVTLDRVILFWYNKNNHKYANDFARLSKISEGGVICILWKISRCKGEVKMQTLEGKKPVAGQLAGVVLNIAVDIWWFTSHGADMIFWAFIGVTVIMAVMAVRALRQSIRVEISYVVLNGKEIPYSEIALAQSKGGAFSQKRVEITLLDGKVKRVPANNGPELAAAIMANKARVAG